MATVQEIEDAIRKLAAKNPKDPGIAALAKARQDMLAGGGAGAPAPVDGGKSFLENAGDYVSDFFTNSQGQGLGEQLMHPEQLGTAIMDQGVIASDFLTQGTYPKLLDWMGGNTAHADRVKEARARAGSAGTGMELATAAAMPSVAAKAPFGPLAKAGIAGLENAAFSSIRPISEGKSTRDILADMAVGGAFGVGGSAAGDLLGKGYNALKTPAPTPRFKTDADLFAESARSPRNTAEGIDLDKRTGKVKELRLAAAEGPEGLKKLSDQQLKTNEAARNYDPRSGRQKPAPYSYDETLKTRELAHQPTPKSLPGKASGVVGRALGGGPFNPLSWKTGGLSSVVGVGADVAADALNSGAARKRIEELAAYMRNAGKMGEKVPPLSPQDIAAMRDLLAKTSGRVGGTYE